MIPTAYSTTSMHTFVPYVLFGLWWNSMSIYSKDMLGKLLINLIDD